MPSVPFSVLSLFADYRGNICIICVRYCNYKQQAFGAKRLDVQNASVLFDLGMGTGKILIQAFLQCKNLRYIFGIELSAGRYKYVLWCCVLVAYFTDAFATILLLSAVSFLVSLDQLRLQCSIEQECSIASCAFFNCIS